MLGVAVPVFSVQGTTDTCYHTSDGVHILLFAQEGGQQREKVHCKAGKGSVLGNIHTAVWHRIKAAGLKGRNENGSQRREERRATAGATENERKLTRLGVIKGFPWHRRPDA